MRLVRKLYPPLAAAIAAVSIGAGCDGCPGGKPYTPYTLTDAAPIGSAAPSGGASGEAPTSAGASSSASDAGAPSDASAPPSAPTFAAIPAEAAPGDGKVWSAPPDIDAKAPVGRAFSLGLLLDVDGDGKRDLVAWTQAPDGLRGELRFIAGGASGEGQTIAALPGDLSTKACSPRAALAQVGPRSIAFDFTPQCPPAQRATRWVALVRLGNQGEGAAKRAPELGLEIRLAAPPSGESLDILVDGSDRDGDGRDDIAAKITLSGGLRPFSGAVGPYPSLPQASAVVAFLDRPTGLSRDPSEPSASLSAAIVGVLADAKKRETAGKVAPAVHQIRRLRSMICDEGGKALVTTSAGPVVCDDTRDVEGASIALATAAATKGDPARALAAIGRLDARGSSAPLSDARKREIIKILGKAAPLVSYQLAHRSAAAPKVEPLGWSPLAFEEGGDLLVRTGEGVTRVERATFAEAPADVAAWPSTLVSEGSGGAGDAWVLAGVEQRCDAPTLVALVEDAGAKGEPSERRTSIALPILTPINARGMPSGGRCSAIASVPVTPIAATGDLGLVFSIGSEIVGLKRQRGAAVVSLVPSPLDATAAGAAQKGAARSPDGATIALPTSRGLLVITGTSARLWSGPEMEQALGCVPSSGGGRVACVSGGAALIYDAR